MLLLLLLVLLVISSSLFVGFDRGEDLTIALPPPPVEEEAPLMSAYDFIVLNNVNILSLALLTVTEMEDGMSAVVKRINLRHVTDVLSLLTHNDNHYYYDYYCPLSKTVVAAYYATYNIERKYRVKL